MKREHDQPLAALAGAVMGTLAMLVSVAFFAAIVFIFTGCGVEMHQEQEVKARVEIYYPNCAQIEDDELLIECIRVASTVKINVDGLESLSADEQDLLTEIGIPPEEL